MIAQQLVKLMLEKAGNGNALTLDAAVRAFYKEQNGGKPVDPKVVPKKSTDNVVVYMLGGGSYYEYDTLQTFAAETQREVSKGTNV